MTTLTAIQHPTVKDFLSNKKQLLFELINAHGPTLHILFPEIMEENINTFRSLIFEQKIRCDIFYALKANKSNSFLEIAAKNQIGVEVSSQNELKKALAHGFSGEKIICSGPCKDRNYLLLSILHNTLISIDSIEEFEQTVRIKIATLSNNKRKQKVLIRINNLSDSISRFGISINQMYQIYKILTRNSEIVDLGGISFHLNGYSIEERANAISAALKELKNAHNMGFKCNIIDIGGGFTIQYVNKELWKKLDYDNLQFFRDQKFKSFYPYYSKFPKEKFLNRILTKHVNSTNDLILNKLLVDKINLIIEPGRSLLDQAGITIMQVKGVTANSNGDNIINVGGNINFLSEQWFNTDFLPEPLLLQKKANRYEPFTASVGGNTCMENDMLTWRKIVFNSRPQNGDLLIYINTAGYQMDSNESGFHLYPIPPKISIYQPNGEIYSWKEDQYFSMLDVISI